MPRILSLIARDALELVVLGLFLGSLAVGALAAGDSVRTHRSHAAIDTAIAMNASEAGR